MSVDFIVDVEGTRKTIDRSVPGSHTLAYSGSSARWRLSTADYSRGDGMTTTSGFSSSRQREPAESLLTLAEFLELALDEGACVVLIRNDVNVCAVYVGDPAGSQDALAGHGTIAVALVNE